jgi:hypothetical protein
MAEDGNCLFRSVGMGWQSVAWSSALIDEVHLHCIEADQIYGDPEMHDQMRKLCLDYMVCSRAATVACIGA